MIVIVDYDTGNLLSIKNMIRKVSDAEVLISNHWNDIEKASKLVLPGVGSFDHGMNKLESLNLIEIINRKVLEEKLPVLGICLGAQLLTKGSEEGTVKGLGFIDATVQKFRFDQDQLRKYKVPHMGWTNIRTKKNSKILQNNFENPRYYFVHSYHFVCNDRTDVLMIAEYGYEFEAAFERENILGLQFHPEKSHKYGMQLIKNFIELY